MGAASNSVGFLGSGALLEWDNMPERGGTWWLGALFTFTGRHHVIHGRSAPNRGGLFGFMGAVGVVKYMRTERHLRSMYGRPSASRGGIM